MAGLEGFVGKSASVSGSLVGEGDVADGGILRGKWLWKNTCGGQRFQLSLASRPPWLGGGCYRVADYSYR